MHLIRKVASTNVCTHFAWHLCWRVAILSLTLMKQFLIVLYFPVLARVINLSKFLFHGFWSSKNNLRCHSTRIYNGNSALKTLSRDVIFCLGSYFHATMFYVKWEKVQSVDPGQRKISVKRSILSLWMRYLEDGVTLAGPCE